ncbi:pectin acetylesterase [Aureococcus anophagefferens]|uniref:Pectin acetylesterase n=1 Tax=Aureococcus anophagefferens TaxID=44056 RepID=A0ABR1G9N7_AURAN
MGVINHKKRARGARGNRAPRPHGRERDAASAVIIASGHHDLRLGRYDPAKQSKERAGALKGRETTAEEYARALARQTFDRLGAWRASVQGLLGLEQPPRALQRRGILGAYDAAAEAEAARRGATFVDVSTPLERHFPQPALTACCGDEVYVHLQGGGFCGSLGACEPVADALGSTTADVPGAWGPTLDLAAERPYFSRNATRNPLLADFTHVFVVYCDGAYFAGNVADPPPRPARRRSSSGGGPSSTPSSRTSTSPARRTGYYADVPYYTTQKRFPFEAQNATAADPQCLADHATARGPASRSSVTAKYVRAPLFAWQSKFDADQLATSFAAPCENASCADPYGEALAAGLRAFARRAARGAFVDACHRHCDRVDAGHDVWNISAQGTTPLVALADWFSDPLVPRRAGAERASYPCGRAAK